MDLNALESFHLVVAHGGIGRASRASGRPKATLSRRVMELEESLGVRLLNRGSRTLRLTEEGETLRLRTKGLMTEIGEAGEAIRGGLSRPRGRLRVCSPSLFSQVYLGRLAADFYKQCPDVELEVVADDRTVDPVEDGHDVVIRVNPAVDDRLVGRCFHRDQLGVAAPPSMRHPSAGRRGKDEVSIPAIVTSTCDDPELWIVEDGRKTLRLRPEPVLRLSTKWMARDAMLAGGGAALLPRSMLADDLAVGRANWWGDVAGGQVQLWALHSSGRLISRKVGAFVEFLCAAFTPHPSRSVGATAG